MDKEDARYQTMEQLHERRKQVVRLHRKGYGVMRVVELSGLSYPTVRGDMNEAEHPPSNLLRAASVQEMAGV